MSLVNGCSLDVPGARLYYEVQGSGPGHRAAVALAERLGAPLVGFPGGHVGFLGEAKDFADVLRRTLA